MRVQVGQGQFGLALGSGGLRGAAHIGVLKSLERHGLRPAYLSGSSAGAVVAVLYAAGYSTDELTELAVNLDANKIYDSNLTWRSLLVFGVSLLQRLLPGQRPPTPLSLPDGLLQGQALQNYLTGLLGRSKFADLIIPTAVLAVDVETGDTVAFAVQTLSTADVTLTKATLVEGVRASSSIPGVFQPLRLHGRTLVDGAIRTSVPTRLLQGLGADLTLAVDLGYAGQRDDRVDNVVEVISQSLNILSEELAKCQLHNSASLIVRPQIYDVSLLDFARIPEIIERGESAMEAQIPHLLQLLASFR